MCLHRFYLLKEQMQQPAQRRSIKVCCKFAASCGAAREEALQWKGQFQQEAKPLGVGMLVFPTVTSYVMLSHTACFKINKYFASTVQYPKNHCGNKKAPCSIPTQDHKGSACSPASDSTYLCCRKPTKGATPVPGPTMTMGTAGSLGKWKEFVVRGEMSIWNIKTT